jgi:hypothetical protein
MFGENDISRDQLLPLINQLTPYEQIVLWRALGEELLNVGNPFNVMIKGMPLLEQAVYHARIEFLKAQEGA